MGEFQVQGVPKVSYGIGNGFLNEKRDCFQKYCTMNTTLQSQALYQRGGQAEKV